MRRPGSGVIRAGVAALPAALLIACSLGPPLSTPAPAQVDASSPATPSLRLEGPHIQEWWVRPDQLGAQSAAGAFAIKLIEVANLDLHAYYVMRAATPGAPTAAAQTAVTVCAPGGPDEPTGPANVQSFGQVGGFDVGVIHIPIADRPGQTITLAVTPPGAAPPAWTLSFVEQVAPISHPHQGVEGVGAMNQVDLVPEVEAHTAFGYVGNRWSGYFALAQPGPPTSYVPSVFFVLEHDGTVSQISQADFTSGTYGADVNALVYAPHPTYAPTSTAVGMAQSTPAPPRVLCSSG